MELPIFVRNYFKPNKLKEEYFELNGHREGIYTSYDIEGNITTVCNYVNGKKNGICYEYMIGKISNISYYVDDKLEGDSRGYFLNGSLSSIINYKNNKKNGISISYYSNGEIKTTDYYTNHRKTGEYIHYYQDGKIKDFYDYTNHSYDYTNHIR